MSAGNVSNVGNSPSVVSLSHSQDVKAKEIDSEADIKQLNSTNEDVDVDTSSLAENSSSEEESSGGFWSSIGNFFKSIGNAIGNFFKSLFGITTAQALGNDSEAITNDETQMIPAEETSKADNPPPEPDVTEVNKPDNIKEYYDAKLGFVKEVYENGELVTKTYEKYGEEYEETYKDGLLTKMVTGSITNTYEYDENGNRIKEVYTDSGYNGAPEGRKHHITQIETYYDGGFWPDGNPKTERSVVQYLEGDVTTSYTVYAEELDEFGNQQPIEFEYTKNGEIENKGKSTIADENGNFYTTHEYWLGKKCNPPKVIKGNIWSD